MVSSPSTRARCWLPASGPAPVPILRWWSRRRMAIVFVTHDIDEAIFLSQRIVLLRPRPGRIDEIVDVRLPARRWEHDPRALPGFIELREHLWDRIRNMVREGAQLEEFG